MICLPLVKPVVKGLVKPLVRGLLPVFVPDVPDPGPGPFTAQTVVPIGSSVHVTSVGTNVWRCEIDVTEIGDGMRFNFLLANLVPGKDYRCDFTLQNIDDSDGVSTVVMDVCDDETDIKGPFGVGAHSFTFNRPSYDSTYRFIDVWIEQEYVWTEFEISGLKITKLN